MIKFDIEFTDQNGDTHTTTEYFQILKGEAALYMVEKGATIDILVARLTKEKDNKKILALLTELIDRSYGVPGEDGIRFHKSDELLANFKAHPAFDELLFNMFTDQPGYSASDFVNGIFPENLVEEVEKLQKKLETTKD